MDSDSTPDPPDHDAELWSRPTATHSWLDGGDDPSAWAPPTEGATHPPPSFAPSVYAPPPPSAAPWPSAPPESPASSTSPTVRPPARAAGALVLVGAALAALGSVLTWATFAEAVSQPGVPRTFNGFTDLVGESKDGPFFVAFAAALAVFGITLLLARRVTAVLVLGAILAGFGAAAAAVDLLDVADPDGVPAALQPSVGVGLPVVVAGFVVAFAGSVVGLAGRRADPR